MKRPLIIAKRKGIDWYVGYTDLDSGEQRSMAIFGSPTVDDALTEAKRSLDALRQDWYVITDVYIMPPTPDEPEIANS